MEFLISSVRPSLSLCVFLCRELWGRRSKILSLMQNRNKRELKHEFNKNKAQTINLLFGKLLFYSCCYLYYSLLAPLTWIQITDRFLQWKYLSQECHSEWRNSWKELKYVFQLAAGLQERLGMPTRCAAGIQSTCKWLNVYGKITHLETTYLQHFLLSAFRDTLNLKITLSDHPDTISELCHGWKPISRF